MSEADKDNKQFEFIKEQVIQKKRKKYKKWLIPFLMTIVMAILFGLVAAVTFCIAEPRLYNFFNEEEDVKTPITFPTTYPDEVKEDNQDREDKQEDNGDAEQGQADLQREEDQQVDPNPVIVETINADSGDYISIYDDIRTIAYRAKKSLVTISSIINGRDIFGNPVEKKITTSGVVFSDENEELLILVSLDRVKNASSIKMELTEKLVVDAVLQDYDGEINLAVISVKQEDIPDTFLNSITVANLGESYTIAVGNPIMALGNPNGYPGSMDTGIITSRGSWASITDNKLDLFNTSIRDNSNSDGVIVNFKGEIIGVITRTLKKGLNENLNTVIGISKIKPIIAKMANQEPRIYFGILAEDMTEAAKLDHNILNGVFVNEVKTKSPAFKAGLKSGDIILQIGEQTITNMNYFNNTISGYQPEDEVIVKIKRTSGTTEKELDLKVTLEEKDK
ncbi:serine protease [Mobilitalea sibirica]|uniref:Serine protease n=1 Tax=Mobilitalea sibirica TaxID=1462919 RepID=A0A8J7KZR0_9FIRM|nr:S1C family serine protease [Mobilitalea sibirica]MBH1940758.1 serine protease [Mobilitalea sibirica]